MRYQLAPDGSMVPPASSVGFIDLTVCLTLIAALGLLALGWHGRQRWLKFWGGLTVLGCVAYLVRGLFGAP